MKEIEEEIMIQYYNGSIFDSKADILCHQVNCQGAFGYGIAGQVKKLFPEVEKTYKRITKQWIEKETGTHPSCWDGCLPSRWKRTDAGF